MKKNRSKVIRILAITASVLLIILTCCIGWLCAAIDAYATCKKQDFVININGDYTDSLVEININSESSSISTQANIYKQLVEAFTATITCATAVISLVAVIIKLKKKQDL